MQFKAILAHEFGHIRGEHGTFARGSTAFSRRGISWSGRSNPPDGCGWLLFGWFVQWYAQHLGMSTLAQRRIHEFQSDRLIAQTLGDRPAAEALLAISWFGHRLERNFWPEVIREAATDPLPPPDILAHMEEFFRTSPKPGALMRWRVREQRTRTPITSDHPCLLDRLNSLGMRALLEENSDDRLSQGAAATITPEASAISLLADCWPRVRQVANATWKAQAIGRWR